MSFGPYRIPVVGYPFCARELFLIPKPRARERFAASLKAYLGMASALLLDSGTAGLLILLMALRRLSAKTEVILPTYTAAGVLFAVRSAGLQPVLCDCSLTDFNLDPADLPRRVNANTLAIVVAHMFGIPMEETPTLKARFPETFLIEDCCQALGSRIKTAPVGSFSDAAVLSFNRGKNMPLGCGGCVLARAQEVAKALQETYRRQVGACTIPMRLASQARLLALAALMQPRLYALCSPALAGMRERMPSPHIQPHSLPPFLAEAGDRMIARLDELSAVRNRTGSRLLEAARRNPHCDIPQIPATSFTAFNRVPLLVRDTRIRETLQEKLSAKGIETSPMYGATLDRQFGLACAEGDLENAHSFCAQLLTLPAHPLLSPRMADEICAVLERGDRG